MPFSRALRHVAPKRKTPSTAVITLGVVSVLLLLSALVSVQAFNYFLGVATLAFFTTYVLQTIGLLIAALRGRIPDPEPGTFDLGRARIPLLIVSLIVFLAVEFALIFLPAFAGNGYVFGGMVAVAGLWWLLVLRRRLKHRQAGPHFAMEHPDEGVPVAKLN
jgi:amino acid transporter